MVIFLSSFGAMAEDEKSDDEDEGFKAKHFLEMPEERQKFWLLGAITALSQVTAMRNKDNAQCINDWYFTDKTAERNWQVLETMKKNPNAKPVGILIYLTQLDCGNYWE